MAKLSGLTKEDIDTLNAMRQMREHAETEMKLRQAKLQADAKAEEALYKVEQDFISSALQGILSNPELVKNLQEESKMEMVPLLANKLGKATAKKFVRFEQFYERELGIGEDTI